MKFLNFSIPVPHESQLVCPALVCVPESHWVHESTPPALMLPKILKFLILPEGQESQFVCPALANVPGPQVSQASWTPLGIVPVPHILQASWAALAMVPGPQVVQEVALSPLVWPICYDSDYIKEMDI